MYFIVYYYHLIHIIYPHLYKYFILHEMLYFISLIILYINFKNYISQDINLNQFHELFILINHMFFHLMFQYHYFLIRYIIKYHVVIYI